MATDKPQEPEEIGSGPAHPDELALFADPVTLLEPERLLVPFVYSSPHSGRHYPESFVAASKLDRLTLRRSEDSFVDELFADAVATGAPLLHANFPRAFLDPNREPYELDPAMFDDPLPPHVNTRSLRVAGGLGTIARVVADSTEIYRGALSYAEAERRIRHLYMPYHEALRRLLENAMSTFGCAVLVDCHSMPSIGGPADSDRGSNRPDIVLGDRYGVSCAPELMTSVERFFIRKGYKVARNVPYAGGFNTEHYGRPERGLHAIQIELNRALYMNEIKFERSRRFHDIRTDMRELAHRLAEGDWPALLGRANKSAAE